MSECSYFYFTIAILSVKYKITVIRQNFFVKRIFRNDYTRIVHSLGNKFKGILQHSRSIWRIEKCDIKTL